MTWKTNVPIWIKQWPSARKKLEALEKLVREQLSLGHIEPNTSPWNSAVFVIKKKKNGKWRLLTDLHAINACIQPMGSLQSGLSNPSMIPQD